jgi:uncharacterized membrane protein YtjA (UPF0391 family)
MSAGSEMSLPLNILPACALATSGIAAASAAVTTMILFTVDLLVP